MAQSTSNIVSTTASKLMGVWIHDPSNPAETSSQFLYGNTSRTEDLGVSSISRSYVGRALPVYDMGGFESSSLDVDILIPSGDDEQELVEWFRSTVRARNVLCYRDNRGRLAYGIISDIRIAEAPVGTRVTLTSRPQTTTRQYRIMTDKPFKGYVYGLHTEDGVIKYIGQTMRDPVARLKQHRYDADAAKQERDWPVYRWMRKHGTANIQMVILAETNTKDSLNELETTFINLYGLDNLYNCKSGGENQSGYTHSAETRLKQSIANTGKKRSADSIAKQSQALKGNQHKKGKKQPPESIAKGLCTRWHKNRNKIQKDCPYWCAEQAVENNMKDKVVE